jgi:hypothetical protein
MPDAVFGDLSALAQHLRDELDAKKSVLIYAYNGTGKTRLSTAFKDLGKVVNDEGETTAQDTLYFNAFTEDLFFWDNDLANDVARVLRINSNSRFFAGLAELEMDNRIRPLLAAMPISISASIPRNGQSGSRVWWKQPGPPRRSTTSRFHAVRRTSSSGAFSWQSSNSLLMRPRPTSG